MKVKPGWERGLGMRILVLLGGAAACLFMGVAGRAQNIGRIECARSDDYIYLYQSMSTLQVAGTLQCGEIVHITLRYQYYYGVKTAKGEVGFVAQTSVAILKDESGGQLPTPLTQLPRERVHYDKRPGQASAAVAAIPTFTLKKNTPVGLKMVKTISSATAHTGDAVELEVLEDVVVEGVPVLSKGAKVTGAIAEAEPKKRFGHSGRLAFSITSLRLDDGEVVPLRVYEEATATSSGSAVALASKDLSIQQNAEYTVLVDGDVRLKREGFEGLKDDSGHPAAPEALKDAGPRP